MNFLQPKDVDIKTQDGGDKTYVISKFPAIQGREIITQYPISAMPKVGDYKVNEAVMYKLMAFVGVTAPGGAVMALTTPDLIRNHVPDWETLARLEAAMIEYNCSFFQNGKVSTFFDGFAQKLPQLARQILTDLQRPSSEPDAPRSTN